MTALMHQGEYIYIYIYIHTHTHAHRHKHTHAHVQTMFLCRIEALFPFC